MQTNLVPVGKAGVGADLIVPAGKAGVGADPLVPAGKAGVGADPSQCRQGRRELVKTQE